ENGFNRHWHTTKDDMNNIDKNTLYVVGQTVLNVIFDL
ncbi:MAG: M28 family peptidase, partial [Bacteroidota bacterium]